MDSDRRLVRRCRNEGIDSNLIARLLIYGKRSGGDMFKLEKMDKDEL
jgi:hypothetical protein